MQSKKPVPRATSPVNELEQLEPGDVVPESDPVAPKKKKVKKSLVGNPAEAQPPKRKALEQDAEPEVDASAVEIDYDKVRQWCKEFRSSNRRLPSAEELSTNCGFDLVLAKKVYNKMKNEADALKNKKKSKKIRGYHKLACEVGYKAPADNSDKEISGFDILRPMISMADTARLATNQPCTPDAVSVSHTDFTAYLELMETSLPQSVAREITANVEAVFRYSMNSAVKAQIAAGGARINPSTMLQVLKPMVKHFCFSDALTPPGLIKFTKDVQPPLRKEYEGGKSGLKQFKKALIVFNKKVKPADRGMGIVQVDDDDVDEKKLAKENSDAALANGKSHADATKRIEMAKVARAAARKANANKRKREEATVVV